MINKGHKPKATLGRKALLNLPLPGNSPALREVRAGTQGNSLETGTEAKPWRNITYSPWFDQTDLVYPAGCKTHRHTLTDTHI